MQDAIEYEKNKVGPLMLGIQPLEEPLNTIRRKLPKKGYSSLRKRRKNRKNKRFNKTELLFIKKKLFKGDNCDKIAKGLPGRDRRSVYQKAKAMRWL